MNGHRVRGTISGLIFGLGLTILLQQFAIVPLTTLVLVLVPLGCALLGLAIGWPRGRSATAPGPAMTPGQGPAQGSAVQTGSER